MTNFRHMLGLDVNSAVQHKARTMKDSKEIMKKRRERAICIVSIRRSQADLVWPVAIKQSPTNWLLMSSVWRKVIIYNWWMETFLSIYIPFFQFYCSVKPNFMKINVYDWNMNIISIKQFYFQDRVSRVLFPSTFILLNIIYWLVFSDILDSLHSQSDLQTHT